MPLLSFSILVSVLLAIQFLTAWAAAKAYPRGDESWLAQVAFVAFYLLFIVLSLSHLPVYYGLGMLWWATCGNAFDPGPAWCEPMKWMLYVHLVVALASLAAPLLVWAFFGPRETRTSPAATPGDAP